MAHSVAAEVAAQSAVICGGQQRLDVNGPAGRRSRSKSCLGSRPVDLQKSKSFVGSGPHDGAAICPALDRNSHLAATSAVAAAFTDINLSAIARHHLDLPLRCTAQKR